MIYENIDEFLNNNNDHLISFTVSTNNNLNLIQNLLSSAEKNNIKIVLFALDNYIVDFIKDKYNIDIVLFMIDNIPNQNSEFFNYEFGTDEWKQIVYFRYFIAHRLLKDGRNIVYLDTDIYINRNYLVDIKEKLRQNNIVIQNNGRNCCTGFFAMKSCKKLINFFSKKNMLKLNCYDFGGNGGSSDQKFFNHHIGTKMQEFNCALLERNFYPNGNHYYENHEMIDEYCFIIHFNCVQGEFKKIKRVILYNKLLINLIDYLPDDQLEDPKIMRYKNLLNEINENNEKEKIIEL